ncbi:hypothetical protein [Desulfurobacterium sp.]
MASWQNLTLGDVFTGPAKTLEDLREEANSLSLKIDAVSQQLLSKASALQDILSTTNSLLDGLTNTGISVLYLEPDSGNLVDRISLAADPPQGDFSAGIVLGVSAVDIAAVADRYQQLISILTSPVSIPK